MNIGICLISAALTAIACYPSVAQAHYACQLEEAIGSTGISMLYFGGDSKELFVDVRLKGVPEGQFSPFAASPRYIYASQTRMPLGESYVYRDEKGVQGSIAGGREISGLIATLKSADAMAFMYQDGRVILPVPLTDLRSSIDTFAKCIDEAS
jgi:hypothetical protein